MKKFIASLCIIASLVTMSGCSDNKVIEGKEYQTYGFINSEQYKDSKIQYKVCVGNVVWGTLLFSTVIAPVYFFGFDLYEPVGKK